jgi:hypothetical protein
MTEFYTNLPKKELDSLGKSIKNLTSTQYEEKFEFNQNELDAAIGFFVRRGFDRGPAEDVATVILRQSKIDSVPSQEILDQLTKASPVELSELITVVLNANRFKSSRLGVRNQQVTKNYISRNIKD